MVSDVYYERVRVCVCPHVSSVHLFSNVSVHYLTRAPRPPLFLQPNVIQSCANTATQVEKKKICYLLVFQIHTQTHNNEADGCLCWGRNHLRFNWSDPQQTQTHVHVGLVEFEVNQSTTCVFRCLSKEAFMPLNSLYLNRVRWLKVALSLPRFLTHTHTHTHTQMHDRAVLSVR